MESQDFECTILIIIRWPLLYMSPFLCTMADKIFWFSCSSPKSPQMKSEPRRGIMPTFFAVSLLPRSIRFNSFQLTSSKIAGLQGETPDCPGSCTESTLNPTILRPLECRSPIPFLWWNRESCVWLQLSILWFVKWKIDEIHYPLPSSPALQLTHRLPQTQIMARCLFCFWFHSLIPTWPLRLAASSRHSPHRSKRFDFQLSSYTLHHNCLVYFSLF